MIRGILGRKLGMSQLFKEDGEVIPVTLIQAGPCFVIQKKIKEKDGYDSIQLGFGSKKPERVNKPLKGHFDKSGKGCFSFLREVPCDDVSAINAGDEIKAVDVFETGETVRVTGTSKGKGFAGVVRRHGFGGLPASHGSLIHRATGSIGCSADPSKVIKGKKMPGHMGDKQITIKGLEIVDIREEDNVIALKGAVPGSKGQIVMLRKQGN